MSYSPNTPNQNYWSRRRILNCMSLFAGTAALGGCAAITLSGAPNTHTWEKTSGAFYPSTQEGGGIESHIIGKEYGINADDLMSMMGKDTFRIWVNHEPVTINTKDFLTQLLETDIVPLIGKDVYNQYANQNVEESGRIDRTGIGIGGIEKVFLVSPQTEAISMEFYQLTTDQLYPRLDIHRERHGIKGEWNIKSGGPTFKLFSVTEDQVFMELADRVFPNNIRKRRNESIREEQSDKSKIIIDDTESLALIRFIYTLLQKPYFDALREEAMKEGKYN